jgi:small-conductance mechanosensitive channel
VLDGRILFKVSDAGAFTAEERAEIVNRQLNDTIRFSDINSVPPVTVTKRAGLTTLLLNDRYLLTVTEKDVQDDKTTEAQANVWADTIRAALQQSFQERRSDYLQKAIWLVILALFGAIGLHLLLGWIHRKILRKILASNEPQDDPTVASAPTPSTRALRLLLWITRSSLWIGAVIYITNLFPWTRYQVSRSVIAVFSAPILTLGDISYSLTELMILVIIVIAWIIVAGLITNWLKTKILRASGIDRGFQEIIATFIRYTLMVIGLLVILQVWGANISSLTIMASALGLGIGFGFQDLAKNISGGFVLLVERLVQVGDFVEVGENKGTIEHIGSRSTKIRTLDDISITVPNTQFLDNEVINWSKDNPISRIHVPVGVAYGTDPYQLKSALLEVAAENSEVLTSPVPQVFFKGFGDSSLDFELLVWTDRPERQFVLRSDLNYRIYASLQRHNIEIPFPQRDLHIKSAQISLSPEIEQALLGQWHRHDER